MPDSPEYQAYRNAKSRCITPTNTWYFRYGGRGIQFKFSSFPEFLEHIGPKPTPKHSLDRIDGDGHYEIGNVRWATRQQQEWGKTTKRANAKSRYRGVTVARNRFYANIKHYGKQIYLGSFITEVEAALAFDAACIKLRGSDGVTNF